MKRIKELLKQEKIKKVLMIGIPALFLIFILLFVVFKFYGNTKDIVKTKDIKMYYRTYTKEKGWTSWRQNGQFNGTDKYPIRAMEVKVKAKNNGDVFYNTYSKGKWNGNDAYSGKTSGNKKDVITKVKIMLSDTLYSRYETSYRLMTDSKTTEYGHDFYELSGDSKIYKIQIIVKERK